MKAHYIHIERMWGDCSDSFVHCTIVKTVFGSSMFHDTLEELEVHEFSKCHACILMRCRLDYNLWPHLVPGIGFDRIERESYSRKGRIYCVLCCVYS